MKRGSIFESYLSLLTKATSIKFTTFVRVIFVINETNNKHILR